VEKRCGVRQVTPFVWELQAGLLINYLICTGTV